MGDQSQKVALADVQSRLNDRFPQVADEIVEATVRVAHAALKGRGSRSDPALVEQLAFQTLATMVDPSDSWPALRLPTQGT